MKKIFILFFFIQILTVFSIYAYDESLLFARYDFNGNAKDISGTNEKVVLKNVSYTTDRYGKSNGAIYLSGEDSYIKFPFNINQSNDFTFSFWVYPMDISKDHHQLIFTEAGKVFFKGDEWYIDNGKKEIATGFFVEPYEWQFIAIILKKDGTILFFKNDKFVEVGKMIPKPAPSFLMGKNGRLNSQYFKGKIDSLKIFSTALKPDDIKMLYKHTMVSAVYPVYFEYDFQNREDLSLRKNNPVYASLSFKKEGSLKRQIAYFVSDQSYVMTPVHFFENKNSKGFTFASEIKPSLIKNKTYTLFYTNHGIMKGWTFYIKNGEYSFFDGKREIKTGVMAKSGVWQKIILTGSPTFGFVFYLNGNKVFESSKKLFSSYSEHSFVIGRDLKFKEATFLGAMKSVFLLKKMIDDSDANKIFSNFTYKSIVDDTKYIYHEKYEKTLLGFVFNNNRSGKKRKHGAGNSLRVKLSIFEKNEKIFAEKLSGTVSHITIYLAKNKSNKKIIYDGKDGVIDIGDIFSYKKKGYKYLKIYLNATDSYYEPVAGRIKLYKIKKATE